MGHDQHLEVPWSSLFGGEPRGDAATEGATQQPR
jgi:hypothetical protein